MNLKSLLIFVGIVSLTFPLIVSASKVDLVIQDAATNQPFTNANPYTTCPGPITPQQVSVIVKNIGSKADTYSLTYTTLPSGWKGSIQAEVPVPTGKEMKADLLLVNMPSPSSLTPGLYNIKIQAKSLSSSDKDEAILPVEILPCFSVSLVPKTSKQQLCQETGGSKQFKIEIENTGKFEESYSLKASTTWAKLSEETVKLKSGAKKTITATLTPPKGLKGQQKVEVTAKSTSSYSSSKATINLDIRDCYDFSLKLSPKQEDICFGESQKFTLEINNLGEADVYSIEAPKEVKAEPKIITASPGISRVQITATPSKQGVLSFEVNVKSSNDKDLSKKVSGVLNARECRGIAVILSPAEKTVCSGENVEYTATLKNTGTVEEKFTITSNKGVPKSKTVTLKGEETKTMLLTVDTSGLSEEEIITLTASADGISDSAKTILKIENCYDASLTITPIIANACPCASVDYTVILKNTGKLLDTYTLEYSNYSDKVSLGPGKSEKKSFSVQVSCKDSGKKTISAEAESKNSKVSDSSSLTIKSMETCYGVEMSNGESTGVEVLQGVAVPLNVKNTGETSQEFTFSVNGPSWIFLTPTTLELDAKKESSIYLYASPPYGTKEGKYSISISSSSEFLKETYKLDINVGDGKMIIEEPKKEPVEPEEPKEPEEPIEPVNKTTEENKTTENKSVVISPSGKINLTVTFKNDSSPITGEVASAADISLKAIAVGVITIIIIIILVIRFAVLMKKK